MKKYYIIGFTLLIAFLLFVYAASAGPDSEVVIGTIGFFGIVALLPLFLYVILAETRHIEVESLPKSEEVPLAVPIPAEQQRIEAYGARTPGKAQQTKRDSARGLDRGFIENLRVKQKEKLKDVENELKPRTSLLDIPERKDKIPEPPSEIHGQSDESQGSRLVDIPSRIEEKPEPEDEGASQLISGLKDDKKKESERDEEPRDKIDDSQKKDKENEPEEE